MRDPSWLDPEGHPIMAFILAFMMVGGLLLAVRVVGKAIVFIGGMA